MAVTSGTGPAAAFIRFVVCGGGVTLLGSGALLLVGDRAPSPSPMPSSPSPPPCSPPSCTGGSPSAAAGPAGATTARARLTVLLSYLFTTGALLAFDAVHPAGGALLRQGVYLAASGAAGVARFLLLRRLFTPAAPAAPAVPGPAAPAGLGRDRVAVAA